MVQIHTLYLQGTILGLHFDSISLLKGKIGTKTDLFHLIKDHHQAESHLIT